MPTSSHGNPASNNALNTELNNVARNTNDTAKARALFAQGAALSSINGPHWRHTPLHQAAYHGRYEMAKTLVELGAPLDLHSNPCGRGGSGTPLELARGGGHTRIAQMLEEAAKKNAVGAKPNTTGEVTVGVPVAAGKTLHEKAGTLGEQLGLSRDVPISETIELALCQLGLDGKASAGLSLTEKADACLAAIGHHAEGDVPAVVPVGEPVGPHAVPTALHAAAPGDDSLIDAAKIAGCWGCVCFPLLFTACFRKRATGRDSLEHSGCLLFPIPMPFIEHRERVPGTNGFAKCGEPGNVDRYVSSRCVLNGPGVSWKFW